MTKKKPEQNPIEEAIGDRAKPTPIENLNDLPENVRIPDEPKSGNLPQTPPKPDEPTPSEMLTLEELNHETVERLQDQYSEEPLTQEEKRILQNPEIPVSKPESLLQVAETCSPESPVEPIEVKESKIPSTIDVSPTEDIDLPAEDIELTNLKKYILEDGYNESAVAFHIVTLCTQPMTTPCTTTWDFWDRAMIPEMVFALLIKGGYLEGIWASLKIVMGSNVGNSAWAAGIATTIAFFDTVRMLPILKEMKALDNGN